MYLKDIGFVSLAEKTAEVDADADLLCKKNIVTSLKFAETVRLIRSSE